MSGVERNNQFQFERFEERVLFGSRYKDPSSNVWRVRLLGVRELAASFADQPPFYIHAHPLDADPQIPSFRYPYPPAGDEGKGEPPAARPERDPFFGLAEAELIIELVETRLAPPYQVSFLIDPPLNPNGAWSTSFYVAGSTTPNVTLYSQLPASLSLSQTPGYALGSAYSTSSSVWNAYVSNRAGAQNYFTLSGYLTVG